MRFTFGRRDFGKDLSDKAQKAILWVATQDKYVRELSDDFKKIQTELNEIRLYSKNDPSKLGINDLAFYGDKKPPRNLGQMDPKRKERIRADLKKLLDNSDSAFRKLTRSERKSVKLTQKVESIMLSIPKLDITPEKGIKIQAIEKRIEIEVKNIVKTASMFEGQLVGRLHQMRLLAENERLEELPWVVSKASSELRNALWWTDALIVDLNQAKIIAVGIRTIQGKDKK